ncbi:MAG: 4-diphosphocytidyl-2-C-methyl-D-erythritol kinase [Pirellulaceae bacterium]
MYMRVRELGNVLEVTAPAKINLFLEVLNRRSDGFHDIETLMTSVTIFDSVYFSLDTGGRITLDCDWASGMDACTGRRSREGAGVGDLPKDTDNIVVKAVERLREEAGVELGAKIRLVKRIPSAAGLGGASSDAAAVMVAANHVWKLGWSRDQLAELSSQFGSDIPFFFGDGAAICRGRGELIEPVRQPLPQLHCVIVKPPVGLSTPAVFKNCKVAEDPCDVRPAVDSWRKGKLSELGSRLTNRLQPVAEGLSPWIHKTGQLFGRLDCLGHQMSGSGSSYFGLCRNARHAKRVAGRLRAMDCGRVFQVTTTKPRWLDRSQT